MKKLNSIKYYAAIIVCFCFIAFANAYPNLPQGVLALVMLIIVLTILYATPLLPINVNHEKELGCFDISDMD